MDAILVEYDRKTDAVEVVKEAVVENWIAVCGRFNDDVHRLRDVSDIGRYTGLYECFDAQDKSVFYVVEEDTSLFKLRRKNFLKNIGQ